MSSPLTVVAGEVFSIPLQCKLRGSGSPALFNSDDTLTAGIRPAHGSADVITPAVTWYTRRGNQTGYSQGQVQPSATAAQSALLVPTIPYTLSIHRTLAVGGDPELIVRRLLVVEDTTVS
jgi:hypothetical protein